MVHSLELADFMCSVTTYIAIVLFSEIYNEMTLEVSSQDAVHTAKCVQYEYTKHHSKIIL